MKFLFYIFLQSGIYSIFSGHCVEEQPQNNLWEPIHCNRDTFVEEWWNGETCPIIDWRLRNYSVTFSADVSLCVCLYA